MKELLLILLVTFVTEQNCSWMYGPEIVLKDSAIPEQKLEKSLYKLTKKVDKTTDKIEEKNAEQNNLGTMTTVPPTPPPSTPTLTDLQNQINQLTATIKDLQSQQNQTKTSLAQVNTNLQSQTTSLAQVNTTLQNKITKVNTSMAQIETAPIGTIVAWSGTVLSNTSLPQGWQLCDGSKIESGPMKDQSTPSLNSEGRFLRGGTEQSSWTYQQQMMLQHRHSVSDPGHTHKDRGHSHEYRDIWKEIKNNHHLGIFGRGRYAQNVFRDWQTHKSKADIVSSKTKIRVLDAIGSNLGNEVRPKNMIVQWIIRIF